MSNVLAIIPARSGSKGIPGKNFRDLCGASPTQRALSVANGLSPIDVAVTSDSNDVFSLRGRFMPIGRPIALATDSAAMVDVVKFALEQIPGPPDQKIVLLQPTQPLREPKHITQALALLDASVDSVVSVVELPRTHHPELALCVDDGRLLRLWPDECAYWEAPYQGLRYLPTRRQDVTPAYVRDGTAYCFHRRTVEQHGNIYGEKVKPLIIPASETQALDSPEDWAEAERRLRARAT